MGDISELRGLIVIVSFLGVIILLFGMIPAQFAIGDVEGREVNVPDFFEAIDIYSFADYINFTIDNIISYEEFTLGGHEFWFYTEPNWFAIEHVHNQFWIFQWTHSQRWYDQNGVEQSVFHQFSYPIEDSSYAIYVPDLGTEIPEAQEGEIRMNVKCSHTQEKAYIAYNTTAYSSYQDAYANLDLWIFLGMHFDDVNTAYNAWDLIGMLIFFQLPDIHWVINALIAIPIWVSIAYLSYVLIIKVIPLIGGG